MIFHSTHVIHMIKTIMITGLFKYQSIQNLTAKIKTDRILNHHIFTHQNSAMIHHFFHHFRNAVAVLILGLSMLYNRACLHIGQNMDIHRIKIAAITTISHKMLNLCIAFTKYIRALEISTHELYFIFTSQFMK